MLHVLKYSLPLLIFMHPITHDHISLTNSMTVWHAANSLFKFEINQLVGHLDGPELLK